MKMPEIAATIVLFIGLLTVLVWYLAGRGEAEDSGLELFREDRTDDCLEDMWRLPAADRDGAE